MASPGEDTQHDNFEREETEDLTDVHPPYLHSYLATATPSRRSPQGGNREGRGLRGPGSPHSSGWPPLLAWKKQDPIHLAPRLA
jgi:hypothetical protein